MAEQENIDALMRVLDGFNRNNIEAARDGLDPDVTYIIRGRASASGTYRGPEAFASALRRIKELTGGTMIGQPEVVLAKGDDLYRFRNGKLL